MYEVSFEIRNYGERNIKLWSRRGCEDVAEVYDTFVAMFVHIEVRYKGRIVDVYERGSRR